MDNDDPAHIPTVHTEQLTLRAWRADDVEAYVQLCADPEVMRYIAGGATLPPDVATAQIDRFRKGWSDNGFGLWAVEERATGTFVGFAGLSRPLFLPEVLPAVEVGWRFARAHWRKGYATESGRAALAYGFGTIGLDRIIGIAHEGNVASRAVLTRLGMTLDRTTVLPATDTPAVVYAIDAASFGAT